jgi:hypothetical protein
LNQAVVAHAFNPSTWEAEAGGFLNSRPAWSTERVPEQPGLHREILSRKTKKKKKKQKRKHGNVMDVEEPSPLTVTSYSSSYWRVTPQM